MINKKAILLYSGGQDSTTCLFWALKRFEWVEAIGFDYGQRHQSEIEAARRIALKACVSYQLVKINTLSEFSRNALTNKDIAVDENILPGEPPNTLVEGRNLLFLTYAAIYAKQAGADNLVTGVGQTDYSGYPDCRNEFIVSANQTLNLAFDHTFQIHAPLMWKTKADIWQMAAELSIFELVKHETITCYNGIPGDGCGECPSCRLRQRGLDEYLATQSIQS